jgi:dienelactone hydrolase
VNRASQLLVVAALLTIPGLGAAQTLPRGIVIDEVKCEADPAQSYALYLPSAYSADRKWSLLIAFHPAARGRLIVEKYAAAAERYGYVVAGSNVSRNGPWSVSTAAADAMWRDIGRRFAIDPQRVYLTGMSGGARVALGIALAGNNIAGVIASSAGYPDSQPRATVPFALFATAGTEDFNYAEMRQVDRKLTSPHHLSIFTGGHTLPPDEVVVDAIEWMELQAIKSGRRAPDDPLVDRLLEKRRHAVAVSTSTAETVHLLLALISDFNGLRDVSAEARRERDLSNQRAVKKALARERADEDAEAGILQEVYTLERDLANDERHAAAFIALRDRVSRLAKKAGAADDSTERRQSRRLLRAIAMGASARVQDRAYLSMLAEYGQIGR